MPPPPPPCVLPRPWLPFINSLYILYSCTLFPQPVICLVAWRLQIYSYNFHILLRCYTSIGLAQVVLGSPELLIDSIPPHLLHQILKLTSDIMEAASPAEIRSYEEKEELVWGTFLPYLQYLYKPFPINDSKIEDDSDVHHNIIIRAKLYATCNNVLLHFLESTLGNELHLDIFVKERLLDYTMCLPAVLPGECQPRARSLVNELGKHRQLQPPSLCTLAKAHIAKTFCGLQPVMEMNSIGEFLQEYFPAS